MSKLGCQCGHVIVDQSSELRYKARFHKDQDSDKIYEGLANQIDSYYRAVSFGEKTKWLIDRFGENYHVEAGNVLVLNDIFMYHYSLSEFIMFQCERCGRIKIEANDDNEFDSFLPEDKNQNKELFKSEGNKG